MNARFETEDLMTRQGFLTAENQKRRDDRNHPGARVAPARWMFSAAVFAAELVDATTRVNDLLLAGVEGVAGGADFHVQVLAQGGTGVELVAAAADDLGVAVRGVDAFFHGDSAWPGRGKPYKTRKSITDRLRRQSSPKKNWALP